MLKDKIHYILLGLALTFVGLGYIIFFLILGNRLAGLFLF